MRVAVVFSGLLRGSWENNINDHKKIFPDADFYFHTWEQYKDDYPKLDLITSKEPDPQFNAYENETFLNLRRFREKNFTDTFMSTQQRRVIQFIAHADALTKIPLEYDVIVRARYDVVVFPALKKKYHYYLKQCFEKQRSVGFSYNAFNPDRNVRAFNGVEYPDLDKLHLINKKRLRHTSYEGRHAIPDYMIFHPHRHCDPYEIYSLYKDELLFSSEPGWWQVLCYKKRNPISVHGGALVERFLEDPRMFRKLTDAQRERYQKFYGDVKS